MNEGHLLPPSSTAQERALSCAVARAAALPAPLRDAWNPDDCPAHLLPWLAWAFSVDEWQDSWTVEEQRAVIRNALFIHQHKGTLAALKRAVEPLGYIIKITEYRSDADRMAPFSFTLDVAVTDKGINETIYQQLERLVNAYKNVRSYMRALTLKAEVFGKTHFACAMMSGVETSVYPYIASDLASTSLMGWAAAEQTIDTVAVYPA